MKTTKASEPETGSYYLVIKSGWARLYIDRLESLLSKWCTNPESHVVDAAILSNVPLGNLSETLATALRLRLRTAPLASPARAGGLLPAGELFETLYVYYAAHPGFRDEYDRELRALDESWRSGEGHPADGFVSSILTISIDIDDVDRWLVACVVGGAFWHPAKNNPTNNPRYEALLRELKPELPPIEHLDLKNIKVLGGSIPIIETKNLSLKDLPKDDSVWFHYGNEDDPRSPMRLALSFAGYKFLDSHLFDLLSTVEKIAFDGQPRVLECFNTTGLRLLLFGLQRIHHNADDGLETDALTRAIIAQLRVRLAP